MIEYSVQYHAHSAPVHLFHQFRKQCIACFQIFFRPGTDLVHGRITVALRPLRKRTASVFDDPSVMRIDIVIILNVIFMIRRRYKQRIEVDHLDPQFLQIIQFFKNTLQVSAVKPPHIHCRWRFCPVRHFLARRANINILPRFHVVGRIAVVKTIYENLIHHGAFCPVRRGKSGRDPELIECVQIVRNAISGKVADLISADDLKIIAKRLFL